MAKKNGRTPAGRCLEFGRDVAGMACGIAYAARSAARGDSAELRTGLDTASRFAGLVRAEMPQGARDVRSIEKDAARLRMKLDRAANQRKKISRGEAREIMDTLRTMGKKAEDVFEKGRARCSGGGSAR
jgi:hypothetical protein